MAINSTTNRVTYLGDGSSTIFGFQYEFTRTTDLVVYLYDTVAGGVTPQVLNTSYTVGGTPNFQGVYTSGGTVIFNSSPVSTSIIVITRAPSQVQNFALGVNGLIPSQALVQQFDYLTLLSQRLQDQASRSVILPDGDGSVFSPVLPQGINLNPNAALIVNSSGLGFTFGLVQLVGSSASTFVGVLPIVNGGTGTAVVPNAYGVMYTNGVQSQIISTATPTLGLALIGNGSSAPTFQQLNLSSGVTGILPEANGGTGVGGSAYLQYGVIYASSATQLGTVPSSTAGLPLLSQGSSPPIFSALSYLAAGNGSVSNPQNTFASDTATGWYKPSANETSFAVRGVQAIDMFMANSSAINFGFGAAASTAPTNPLTVSTTNNGQAIFAYANLSGGSLSQSVLACGNGPGGGAYITVENQAYLASGYISGGGVFSAGPSLTQLNIMSEAASSGLIKFNVGGRTLLTERAQITQSSVMLNFGTSLQLNGSSGNQMQMIVANSGASSVWILPTTLGASGTVLTSQGAGTPMIWGTVLVNPMNTLGDIIYGGAAGAVTRLAGNTTVTTKYLAQTGSAGAAQAPVWTAMIAPTKQVFGSGAAQTYTTPVGCTLIKVTALGGGGGGGGSASGAAQASAGGGGGGGGICIGFTANPAATYTYTVGGGGAGGISNASGNGGGNTTFSTFTANAGNGGVGSGGSVLNTNAGGGGGTGNSGTINGSGSAGAAGFVLSSAVFISGEGGGSALGGGGTAVSGNSNGSIGLVYGGGGGGSSSTGAAGSNNGGAGGAGVILVEEFYQN